MCSSRPGPRPPGSAGCRSVPPGLGHRTLLPCLSRRTQGSEAPFPTEGGTTFHFVTDGIDAALEQAVEAADGQDVKLAGGASTIQAYLRAGLVDELHMAISPMLLGEGERLLDNLSAVTDRYDCRLVASGHAVHVLLTRR